MNKIPLTATGATVLREDLEHKTNIERPKIIEAIADARAHGDLKENAEYHAAREQQSFLEGRIAEIENVLSQAQIIEIAKMPHTGKVIFGVTVDVIDIATNEEKTYQIVGDIEADINKGRISISSPIARAMIGKEAGDVATIFAPGGNREVEILKVKYI